MNCDDYLAMLATLPIEELAYGRPRDHAATCRDCDRVTRVVAERERNMVMAYGDLQSTVQAAQVGAAALTTSRRRRIVRFINVGLGAAAVATILSWFAMSSIRPDVAARTEVETFQLQCLSQQQAAGLLRLHLGEGSVGVSFRPSSPLNEIEVEAPAEDIQRAKSLLSVYDTPGQSLCTTQSATKRQP